SSTTLSLHDALPIWEPIEQILDSELEGYAVAQPVPAGEREVAIRRMHASEPSIRIAGLRAGVDVGVVPPAKRRAPRAVEPRQSRSEEHTSELQSREK